MLKVHRFGVTWMASVFACELVPWPEAAFLCSTGFFFLLRWKGFGALHLEIAMHQMQCTATTFYGSNRASWALKSFLQSVRKKSERGNGTKKLVITSGISNTSA